MQNPEAFDLWLLRDAVGMAPLNVYYELYGQQMPWNNFAETAGCSVQRAFEGQSDRWRLLRRRPQQRGLPLRRRRLLQERQPQLEIQMQALQMHQGLII